MTRSVHYYDALQYQMLDKHKSIPPPPTTLDPTTLPNPSYKLSSRLPGVRTVSSINNEKRYSFTNLLKSFLDTSEEHHEATRSAAKMPFLDINEIEVYQTLTIEDYETDGRKIFEKIRTHEVFYKRERLEYAVIIYDDGVQEYGNVHMFFRALYKGEVLDLCLAQRYISVDEEHVTGLEVVRPAVESNYNGMFIAYIDQIDRSVSIRPNFKYGKLRGSDLYVQYLVHTDTDRFLFINSRGQLKELSDGTYKEWTIEYVSD